MKRNSKLEQVEEKQRSLIGKSLFDYSKRKKKDKKSVQESIGGKSTKGRSERNRKSYRRKKDKRNKHRHLRESQVRKVKKRVKQKDEKKRMVSTETCVDTIFPTGTQIKTCADDLNEDNTDYATDISEIQAAGNNSQGSPTGHTESGFKLIEGNHNNNGNLFVKDRPFWRVVKGEDMMIVDNDSVSVTAKEITDYVEKANANEDNDEELEELLNQEHDPFAEHPKMAVFDKCFVKKTLFRLTIRSVIETLNPDKDELDGPSQGMAPSVSQSPAITSPREHKLNKFNFTEPRQESTYTKNIKLIRSFFFDKKNYIRTNLGVVNPTKKTPATPPPPSPPPPATGAMAKPMDKHDQTLAKLFN